MKEQAETTLLVDAYSQIFRSFFAIRHLTNSRGEPVNALFVFTRLLLQLEKNWPGRRGAMLFDCGKVAFRLALNPEYKANRPPMPEELKCQLPAIRAMAQAFGWPLLSCENYEADDLIGGFALHDTAHPVRIVTGDKDISQIVDDRVRLLIPANGGAAGFEERGPAEVVAKFGVPPVLIPDYLALVGDSSDNIPGVPGVGPKSAAAILNGFGPISRWIDAPEILAGSKFSSKLSGRQSLLRTNLELVRLRCDLPDALSAPDAVLRRGEPDWATIVRICREQEFKSLLRELPALPAERGEEPELFPRDEEPAASRNANKNSGIVQGELF
ncbi:MAG: 5'-3' exonuclease H3TH domain-containing protein [Bacteroidales bacterium]|nr:5'-3' exonuclease H3TH domain-containing protein [Bacteroidales bacterium]